MTIYDKTNPAFSDPSNLGGYFSVEQGFGEQGFVGQGNDSRFNSGQYQAMIRVGSTTGSSEIGYATNSYHC